MKKPVLLTVIVLFFTVLFTVSGYLLSDDKYFNDLIRAINIDTPEKAFQYLKGRIEFVTDNSAPIPNLTPRYMLEKKYLWCDEGAIVLATIVHELGFETRLVDVVNENGVSGHTYLQIYENGEWKNYDTVLKKSGIAHEQILEEFRSGGLKGSAQPRPYPRLYNLVIQNNYYLKHLALWLSDAPG
jgi:hypothetical protein